MRLVDVYGHDEALDVLHHLLAEREPHQNISHKAMPTWEQHCAFVRSKPYAHWYLIDCGDITGATYLTHQREIGVGILRKHRGNGFARNAIRMLMERHPGTFLANISPANSESIKLFTGLGFNLIQSTYAIE